MRYKIKERYYPNRWLSKHTEDVFNILHCHMVTWTENSDDGMIFDQYPIIMKILGNSWYEVYEYEQ